jgi:hypothetical protein
MTSTASGPYVLASDAQTIKRALDEAVRTAGDYFDMVERGEISATEARAALQVSARLDMTLLMHDADESCNAEAGTKALKGDERKQFMSECLKADKK